MKRSSLYKAIRDHVKASFPDVAIVDLQKQQIKRKESADHYPFPLPAFLVEFKTAKYSQTGKLTQIGDLEIIFTLYHDLITDTHDTAELEDETLDLLDNTDDVFESFQGFTIPEWGILTREEDLQDQYGLRWIAFSTRFTVSKKDIKDIDLGGAKPTIKIIPKAWNEEES